MAMAEFRGFISDAALVHLPFSGCPYTWHNCSEGSRSLWRRLDRVLVNETWLVKWPSSSYFSAIPSTSDHSPLVLVGAEQRPVSGCFRFDNFLTKQAGFLDAVRGVWRHHIYGTKMYGVVCKLKALKTTFRACKKKTGELSTLVCRAKEFLDIAQCLFELYKEDILLELVQWCRVVYCKAAEMETSMLRQRAKVNWLKYGDQCSSTFFRKINARRASQRVYQITNMAGETLTDANQVAAEFIMFFQTLLGGERRARMLNCDFLQPHLKHTITMDEAADLVRPVTQAEIRTAFFDISEDSAPGPDGYTSGFFKAAWPEIGADLCAAVAEFFTSGQLLKQLNATLLVLIPKVQLPVRVSEFRPIACCNVVYKAIAKILVGRMQQVLHLLVDFSQNAFVPGRSIADNILLAQELLTGYNQLKLPKRCTIKVDIQKAYDSVQWDFMLECLKLFRFPSKFITWIAQCLTTVSFSISLNGSVHGFFAGARGLRQGDPMSPYLFVLVMELFHALLKFRIRTDGRFQHHWKCEDLNILNLGFADDVLLFCAGHVESEILEVLGFQEGSLPIKYLGVPLTASRLTIADCQPLLDKVSSRISGWSHLSLSFAGRVQVIKSVLSALHMYWGSVFILPKAVIKVLERRMTDFLWKGPSGAGYTKVAWVQCCKPKEEGGLGIRSVQYINQALILKQIWRILQNPVLFGWHGCSAIDSEIRRFGLFLLHRRLGFGGKCLNCVPGLKKALNIG
ncbi:UNVERIFIED_CONTAM: Retrovirus-related Pol polyprotein from type-2 retrotransposable element R2DM [Sesamum radiatum]|uniref:Retrovirus-related Pol polyprotein from type-2 retrotransposable element R2DM n=1 Tax=Sesamum radiatum TaxID=300843 RepID=A0AAW2IQN4_SESRA